MERPVCSNRLVIPGYRRLTAGAQLRAGLLALLLIAGAGQVPSAEDAAPDRELRTTAYGASPWAAFDDLRRSGLRVLVLGTRGDHLLGCRNFDPLINSPRWTYFLGWRDQDLVVPYALRRKEVLAQAFVEQVAGHSGLKVHWTKDSGFAILHQGADDADVASVLAGLKSPEAALRADAARRARWTEDVRVIGSLVETGGDADAEVRRQALVTIDRLGWAPALALRPEAALKLLTAPGQPQTPARLLAIGLAGGEPGLRHLESREIWNVSPFRFRILAMGLAGGDRAVQAIIRHAGDQDAHREEVALAAGLAGGKEALAPVKRGLSKEQPELAVAGAAFLGGEAGVELLTDALRCKNVEARRAALTGLGWTGGGKTARDVLTKALNDADESIAAGALRNLGIALGLDALPQLEKCAADAIKRSTALDALGDVGGEPAVRIVEALAAKNPGRMEPSLAYSCFLAVRRAGLGREADNRALAILSRAPEQFGGNDPSYIARIKSLGPGQASADQVVAFAEMALTARNPVVVVPGFLAAVRDDRAQTMLIKAMAHRDDYVFCDLSAQMLARSCGDRAIPLLEKALTSRDRWAPSAAIKALGHIGGRRAFELLEKQNSNREALIRISTILALKEVGGPEAQRLLLAMARTESDPDRRRVIRNSLADDEGRKAFDALPAPVSR